MYASLSNGCRLRAPWPELFDYLNRNSFQYRSDTPTAWELDVRTTTDPMVAASELPGNVVVFAGRKRGRSMHLGRLPAGQHVFADKPWIITSNDIPKLEEALDVAERTPCRLRHHDERYEVTSELQRVLVNSPEISGN